jgi:hypothetical protein
MPGCIPGVACSALEDRTNSKTSLLAGIIACFLQSGARKAAQPPSPYAIPLRQQVLEFEYMYTYNGYSYCTCVCEGHADRMQAAGRQSVEPQWFVHISSAYMHSPHIHLSRRSIFFFAPHHTSVHHPPDADEPPCYHCTACLLQDRRHRALGTYDGAATSLSSCSVVPTTLTLSSSSSRPAVMSPLLASIKQRLLVSLPILEEAKCSGCSYTRVA